MVIAIDHKLIFPQKQDPIDRIEMIAQVWENKVFERKITKKNTWENHKINIEIKIKNQFPKYLLLFDFFQHFKTNKDKSFSPKIL